MEKRWESAANLDRAVLCPASSVLPKVDEPTKAQEAKREWGHIVHHWIETGGLKPDAPPWGAKGLEEKLQMMAGGGVGSPPAEAVRLAYWPEGGRHELQIVWDLDKDPVLLDSGEHWPAVPGSVRIKLDYLGFGEASEVKVPWVDDVKTGYFVPPATTLQVGSAVTAIAEMSGDRLGLGTITAFPRYPKPAGPKRDPQEYGALDFVRVKDLLKRGRDGAWRAHEAIARGEDPEVFPGDHCTYCRSQAACPVTRF